MKLIVCYGHVKVIVPCGDGDITVKSLIDKATSRYRKATNKNHLDHVIVKHFQTEEGGILDPDDIVSDICDDKDKLIAVFDEAIRHRPENNGDSASTSSIDSRHDMTIDTTERIQPVAPPPGFDNEVVEGPSSENGTNVEPKIDSANQNISSNWRKERPPWKSKESSKAPSFSRYSSSASSTPLSSPDVAKETLRFNGFDRNLNRKSLSVGHPLLYSWIDAQEKMNESGGYSAPYGPTSQQESADKPMSPGRDSFSIPSTGDFDDIDDMSSSASEEIEIEQDVRNDLGLKVQGYKNAEGRELGLIVHEVKSKAFKNRSGSLNVADRITEVNGINLRDKSNTEAELILNKALSSGCVKLKRTRSHNFVSRSTKKEIAQDKQSSLPKVADAVIMNSREAPRVLKVRRETEIHEAPIEDPEDLRPAPKALTGKRIEIKLLKGNNGLGFSITSRDVITNGPSPVFVKNILTNGAAIQDGRLKIGDQLLEINHVNLSGKDQTEVVNLLKKATGVVHLVVNREIKNLQETDEIEESVETVSNDSGISAPKDEFLSITIPLNDLGPAGLGISVQGKVCSIEACDLGIYIKSVIKGGAAAKDGRLKKDDRILRIDDVSLDGMTNDKAMDAMRSAMKLAVKKGSMQIFVSRKFKKDLVHQNAPTTSRKLPTIPSNLNGNKQSALKQRNGSEPNREWNPATGPGRTKSYFKAVYKDTTDYNEPERTINNASNQRNTMPQVPTSEAKSTNQNNAEVVSISSKELPVTKPSRTVIIEKSPSMEQKRGQIVEVRSTVFPKDKDLFFQKKSSPVSQPPSYAETIQSRSSSISDSSSQFNTPSHRPATLGFQSVQNKPEEYRLSDSELLRTMSTSSRFSIDSLMISPTALPFERDAFGRLSMSERKGRAHLDATKSDFYSKMKKYKSLEDVSFNKDPEILSPNHYHGNRSSTTDDIDAAVVPMHEAMRRTESLDTMLSNSTLQGEHDDAVFQRGTFVSSSTPWYAQRSVSPTAIKLRSRSTAWNDSFRTAVDKTPVFYTRTSSIEGRKKAEEKDRESTVQITMTSNANYDAYPKAKKKSGFLKGIGQLLKKGKQRKLSESNSETKGNKTDFMRPEEEKLIDFSRKKRPHSMNEETIRATRLENNSARERERAKREKEEKLAILQRELKDVQQTEIHINRNILQYESEHDNAMPQERQTNNLNFAKTSPPGYGITVQIEKRNTDGDNRTSNKQMEMRPEGRKSLQSQEVPIQMHGQNRTSENSQMQHKPPLPRRSEATTGGSNEQDTGVSKQRYLPTSQLFYYGHSSLPRKFTMSDRRKRSLGVDKSSAYSIEAQTEIFRRANDARGEFESQGNSRASQRSPTQPNVGSITISHAAKV